MGAALAIRDDRTPQQLRRRARFEPNRRAALRMLALANALDGMRRAGAARLAGMERLAPRGDAVWSPVQRRGARRGARRPLDDRPKPGRPQRLSEGEQAALAGRAFTAPDPAEDGVCAWTRADLCRWLAARFKTKLHPSSLGRGCSGAWSRRRGRRHPAGPSRGRPGG